MKRARVILSIPLISWGCGFLWSQAQAAEKAEWRFAIQSYSYKEFTFFEAIDKTAALGVKWIEAFPQQKLSPEKPDLKFNHQLPDDILDQVKQKLASAGVQLVNYGVVGLPNDEAECRKVFEFAKKMGIETIVSEPPQEALEMIDKLCQEYGVNVALHNHPKPKSKYWNPDTVVEAVKDRSKRIGACADTGHWMRSEVDPLEALKKLEGRIISLHIKDLDKMGPGAKDAPLGSGGGDLTAWLKELRRQGLNPVLALEYEGREPNKEESIAKSVEGFKLLTANL